MGFKDQVVIITGASRGIGLSIAKSFAKDERKWCIVKVPPNMFLILMEQFPYDYVYDKYRDDAQQIRTQFGLEITSVLWFTKHESAKHDPNEYINKYYFLDEFVCLRKLLDFKNKYFW